MLGNRTQGVVSHFLIDMKITKYINNYSTKIFRTLNINRPLSDNIKGPDEI